MKKRYKKIMLFLSLCLSLFIGLTISSHAYYINNDGNLQSSNLFNDISLRATYGITYTQDNSELTFNVSSTERPYIYFTVDGVSSGNTYTISIDNNTYLSFFEIDNNRITNSLYYTFVVSGSTFDLGFEFNSNITTSQTVKVMLNSGSIPLPYEVYNSIYYSQTNYDNYGSSQYSQGYTDGFNSIYNSLIDVNLSEHVTGIGCGIYDSTGTTFVQNGTITSAYFESDYYYFNVSPVIANNYYVIPISFDNSYIFSSFRWSPNRFTSPSLIINGVTYDSSSVTYNGTSYGWDNLNANLDNSSNSVEFKFKINSNFDGLNLFINGKNLEIASALESYQSGYNNGQSVGYNNGYNDGFTAGSQSITTDNSNFQKLIWTIGSTPFESFKTIWDVDVMGLNISGIILGSLMALLVLYLIKKIWK